MKEEHQREEENEYNQESTRVSKRTNKEIPAKLLCHGISSQQYKNIRELKSWKEMIELPDKERKNWIKAARNEITRRSKNCRL